MPTSPLMQIPKSRSPEEFESLCTDVLTNTYNKRFTLYGRNGQKQNGIDIYVQSDNGNYIVAQCKNYFSISSKNIIKQIEKDVEAAKQTKFQISKFIVMMALDKDSKVQDSIMNINSTFNIELWFWEDIQQKVCNDNILFRKYYPSFFENTQVPVIALNEIISNLSTLKSVAYNLNFNYSRYKVAYHQQNDIDLYNHCVVMFNSALQVRGLKDKWYLQLKKIGVIDIIEEIISSMPDFHDANEDYTGATMVYTLTNYLGYFCSDENTTKFIKSCENVVEELKRFEF